ncbi:MAG TPA: phenylpyruvate tautomerase MIF-related protein [Polyangiaceae bacterium]|nr:phenylpyruvate tautomerase MIF-related protein [Polyangiaceae bacterium]
MPLLKITTSVDPSPEHGRLLANLSRLLAERLGKPESYVMTAIEHPALMTFGGTTEPTCYVEVKNVGRFTPELTQRLSGELCERLSAALGVQQKRIYIEFADAQGYLWGHDGDTFG